MEARGTVWVRTCTLWSTSAGAPWFARAWIGDAGGAAELKRDAQRPRSSGTLRAHSFPRDAASAERPLVFEEKSCCLLPGSTASILGGACTSPEGPVAEVSIGQLRGQQHRRGQRVLLSEGGGEFAFACKENRRRACGEDSAQPCAMADAGHRQVRLISAAKPPTSTTAAARTTSLRPVSGLDEYR